MAVLFDIGPPAIDRSGRLSSGTTRIARENPASQDGTIQKVAIFANQPLSGCQVAIFFNVGGNSFTTRSDQLIGDIPSGYSEHDVSLECKTGDYIGCYFTGGRLDSGAPTDAIWYKAGDNIPCAAQSFTLWSPANISLYGWCESLPVTYERFYITSMQTAHWCKGFTLTFETDVACHMYLRNTREPPWKHPISRIMRGLTVGVDARFCFVAYADLEQNEAGDTTTHTFTWPDWEFCQTQYFYLWASAGGSAMISTSPIIHLTYPGDPQPFKTCDLQELDSDVYSFCQYWNATSQTFQVDHDFTLIRLSLLLAQYEAVRRGPYCIKITEVGGTCWAEKVIHYIERYSTDLPAPGVKTWTHFPGGLTHLWQGKTYRIVVHTLPGWEWWNGSSWEDWEAGAAIRWYYQSSGNPYPHGMLYSGCNFKDKAAGWNDFPNDDATFVLWQNCPSLQL